MNLKTKEKYVEKLIKEYPLTNKIESELNCYLLAKRRYLVFWEDLIEKKSMETILNYIQAKTKNFKFSKWKAFIIIGKTQEVFIKKDLFWFDGVNTFAVFYLINEKENEIFMDDSWIFTLGCNYKKYVRRINQILLTR